jgi:hypothetical protein
MSRYNQHSGSGTGSSSNDGDFDDTTLKLQKYSAIRVTGKRVNAFDSKYGDKFIVGFDDVEILDGIVFQREDKQDTWKVFSPGKFFAVDSDTGGVYENAVEQDDGSMEFNDEMSAQDILEHPRVLGFSETFGGNDYFYQPVGVVVEATGSIATNDDLHVETTDHPSIAVGEVSMLLSNKSWVRTIAKLLTEQGNDIIATEQNEEGNTVSVTDGHGWLTTMEPSLREGIEGREMELFTIEETAEFGDEEVQYTTPILLDAKTGERITIDNFDGDDDGDESVAADGGAQAASTSDNSATESTETTESPDNTKAADEATSVSDESGDDTPANVPAVLDDLIDYFARTDGEVEPDELREFAEDEVDDPDDVDWDAAAAEVESRAGDL